MSFLLLKDYGPLQPLLDSYLWIVGLGSALYLRWGPGLRNWHPPIDGANKVISNLGALFSGAFAVILFITCSRCTAIAGLVVASIACLSVVAVGLSSYVFLRRSRLYYPFNDPRKPVIGGAELTSAAAAQRWGYYAGERIEIKTPTQILEKLGDPDLVWTRESRSRSEIALLWSYLAWTVAATAGVTSLALALHLKSDVDKHLQPLKIVRRNIDIWSGGRYWFRGRVSNCSGVISWSIADDQGATSKSEVGDIGSSNGIYSAPAIIKEDRLVKIVATSEGVRDEATVALHRDNPPLIEHQIPMTGDDDHEGQGQYILEVIDHRHSWKFTEDKALTGSRTGPELIAELAESRAFSGYDAIICAGTASREFNTEVEECGRAGRRASNLATWLSEGFANTEGRPEIWVLNLQRFHPTDGVSLPPDQTAKERPLIIIGVKKLTPELDLQEGLRDAMRKNEEHNKELFARILTHYPRDWMIARYSDPGGPATDSTSCRAR